MKNETDPVEVSGVLLLSAKVGFCSQGINHTCNKKYLIN